MNIFTVLQIQIFVLYALIKCAAGSINEDAYKVKDSRTLTPGHKKYEYKYDHYKGGPVREEVKKWLDLEFHTSIDVLYALLPLSEEGHDIIDIINNSDLVLKTLRNFENKYSFRFIDENTRQHCNVRIKGRLLFFVRLKEITEEYCKQVQKYFWIEERLEEEMSVKVDKEQTMQEKKKMCRNIEEMKALVSIYEKDRSVQLTEDMILHTVCKARGVLLDLIKV
ncbi:gamete antigen 27/25, putative [Plasmodium malariae]|uniref:Gamete antigen 27/25 (G27/25) n=1 Tax=Plasmodium malariae TaxID=5858 RepID=A0A1A8X3C0_PLAMA|nr:gamete antigen 27/25, putative [Plasmodium malariae]SBS98677.1 gamete antigen 27/25 (G27/25) [Plasmodium malariae]SCP03130.1 gamete antigen 27/25, putative [Plasmodium malariae]